MQSTNCIVLHPSPKGAGNPLRLEETVRLACAIGLTVTGAEIIALARRRPGSLFGTGKRDELARRISAEKTAVVIIDAPLTPVQQRNLERAWNVKVLDRTGLILEIFSARARSREGRLQVELAHLTWQKSRLVRSWTHLERQRGGLGFVGGPGETQIESDRRLISERIAVLRRRLESVRRTRTLHRKRRRDAPWPVVALVGYTNAGKSSLFNRLTGAGVTAANALFTTLDPTMRGVTLPSGRRIILSDTVGFISELPPELITAFRATLEEVLEAQILLHVHDSTDPLAADRQHDVESVLDSLNTGDDSPGGRRLLHVHNKIDALDDVGRRRLRNSLIRRNGHDAPRGLMTSALTGEGMAELLHGIDGHLSENARVLSVTLAADDGACRAWLRRHGHVLSERHDTGGMHLRVALSEAESGKFRRQFPDHAIPQAGSRAGQGGL